MSDARPIALEALLQESAWVRRLAESLVRDPAAADDLVQETWLAALRRPPSVDRPLRPWLRTVVENFAKMRGRGDSARRTREESAARAERASDALELLERVETQRMLAREVLALAEPFRSTVVLRYYEGLSSAEIARRAGEPEGTVRWRLKRGLELLRERLDRRHDGRESWSALVGALCRPLHESGAPATPLWQLAGLLALFVGAGWIAWTLVRGGDREAPAAPQGSGELAALVERSSGDRDALQQPQSRGAPSDPSRASSRDVLATVVDERGVPLRGVELRTESAIAHSDSNGLVRVHVPARTDRLVEFVFAASGSLVTSVAARVDGSRDVHLGEVVLREACRLSGHVLGPDGLALAGALVRLEVVGSRWQGLVSPPLEEARIFGSLLPRDAPSALTDAAGRFRFGGLAEGYARLWASAEGCLTVYSSERPVLAGWENDAGGIVLEAFDAGGVVEGVVRGPNGAVVPFAEIECSRHSLRAAFFRGGTLVLRSTADERGRFRLGLDPRMLYDLAAADPARELRPAVIGPVSPGEGELELRLAKWRKLDVVLRRRDGAPIIGESIEFRDARTGKLLEAESEAWSSGNRRAPYVDFDFVVRARGCAPAGLGPFAADSAPARVEAVLDPSGEWSGVVLDPERNPIAGATVELVPAVPEGRPLPLSDARGFAPFAVFASRQARAQVAASDALGAFSFVVEERRRWYLRAAAPGFASAWLGPFEVGTGGERHDEVLLERGGSLVGRVVRRDGRSPEGVVVGVSRGDGYVRTERVGPDGEFLFEQLGAGGWQLRRVEGEVLGEARLAFAAKGAGSAEFDAFVSDGVTTLCDLVLGGEEGCTFEGSLTIDDETVGPWIVQFEGDEQATPFALVGPRGSFSLRLPRAGSWTLRARGSPLSGPSYEFEAHVVLNGDAPYWSRAWSSGSVTAFAPRAQPIDEVTLAWSDGEVRFEQRAELDARGRASFPRAPAGRVVVSATGFRPVLLDLGPGERVEVELR